MIRTVKKNYGFSLIEIMVVVVIMGILATIVAPKVLGRAEDARLVASKQDIAVIMQALRLYNLDNYLYPTQEQGLSSLVHKPEINPIPSNWNKNGYLDKIPKDPWGQPYQYLSPGEHKEIDVYSIGPNGLDATESDYIGSWQL